MYPWPEQGRVRWACIAISPQIPPSSPPRLWGGWAASSSWPLRCCRNQVDTRITVKAKALVAQCVDSLLWWWLLPPPNPPQLGTKCFRLWLLGDSSSQEGLREPGSLKCCSCCCCSPSFPSSFSLAHLHILSASMVIVGEWLVACLVMSQFPFPPPQPRPHLGLTKTTITSREVKERVWLHIRHQRPCPPAGGAAASSAASSEANGPTTRADDQVATQMGSVVRLPVALPRQIPLPLP